MSDKGSCQMASAQLYHEKQRLQLCAVHSLNNLFQEERFTKADFDRVCEELSPSSLINPHRSILGFGDYDINIIIKLLTDNKQREEKYDAIWFDKRKEPNNLNLSKIFGFVLNTPSRMKVFYVQMPFMRNHWFTVRSINGTYFNLDSKLDGPKTIGNETDVKIYLKEQVSNPKVQMFVIVTTAVATDHSWEYIEAKQTEVK